MRAVILGLASLTIAGNAIAADYLRGSSYEAPPSARYDWSGVYAGAHWAYSQVNASFGTTDRNPYIDPLLRPTIETQQNLATWLELPNGYRDGSSYGVFVGYNSQWGTAVIGLELMYSHAAVRAATGETLVVATGPGLGLIDYAASANITDFGSLRFRMGYAWDWFMPYGAVGLAVGRINLVRSAAVSYVPTPPAGFAPYTDVESKSAVAWGYSLGAGVDIGLTANIFVRGEYEFIQFNRVEGVAANVSSYRGALAVKF